LTPGTKLGPYEIVSRLGEGGMGDVYKAKDTRLGRVVAIKVLKEQFLARFEKEARVVATLNHPNICAIYDVGPNYLVLEYLEGKRLATPQPLKDLLKIGAEVASALEAAHRKGIIHCDLKPGNILITANGAKVLDFGLARQTRKERASTDTTVTAGNIVESTIEGTLPYMSPEQLDARDVDRRTDIFALGAVLYEMATGARAFPGESQSSIIANVLHNEPEPPSKRKSGLPQHLDRIIARCLAKDPEDRWQSAKDIALELKAVTEEKAAVKARTPWLPIAAAAILATAAGYFVRPSEVRPLAQLAVPIPEDVYISNFGAAISPDGKRIAFSAERNGRLTLWLREVDSPALRAIDGSEGTQMVFWSPDNRSIGFFAGGWLKRYDTTTGAMQSITHVPSGRGGSWSPNGSIVFNSNLSSPLCIVPAAGGTAQPFTQLDAARGDMRHILPQALPDGKHVLFFLSSTDPKRSGPYLTAFDNPRKIEPISELLGLQSQAIYAVAPGTSNGYLIFHRDKSLVAQPFDLSAMKLTGAPRTILHREAAVSSYTPGFLNLSISNTGALLSGGSSEAGSIFQWKSLSGTPLEPPWKADDYISPALSRKSDRLAVTRVDLGSGNYDIWLYAPKDPRPSRLTYQPGNDYYAVWSPDEKYVYFMGGQAGRLGIFRRLADGSAEPEKIFLHPTGSIFPHDISTDGKLLIGAVVPAGDRGDIWLIPLDDPTAAAPLLQSTSGDIHAQFSPGPQAGKWIVYTSDEMGQDQIFIRRFDGASLSSEKWQVSTTGGRWPRWRGDGSKIVYLNNEDRFMEVEVRFNGGTVRAGSPRELFFAAIQALPWYRYPYDLSADGKRIAVVEAAPSRSSGFLELILNWPELLNR